MYMEIPFLDTRLTHVETIEDIGEMCCTLDEDCKASASVNKEQLCVNLKCLRKKGEYGYYEEINSTTLIVESPEELEELVAKLKDNGVRVY